MTDQFPTLRTLEDYVRAAIEAGPRDREAQLREAEKLAVNCFSAREFLRLLITHDLGDDVLRRRIADRVLAMALAERDISGIRDAAEFQHRRLNNEAAAFTILSDAIGLFATPTDEFGLAKYGLGEEAPAPGYVFVLLAEAFVQLPNGRDGALQALTVGRDWYTKRGSPEDLEDIANGWIELIDRDGGQVLLERAKARRTAADPTPVASSQCFPQPHPPGAPFPPLRTTFGPQPSPSALLDLIRSNIAQASLETIAAADYGMDFADHLAALTAIKDTGLVSTPTPWVPGEVLALYRWNGGGRTDHLARAFCCAVLTLDASLLSPTAFMVTTAPYLVESCLVLGQEYIAAGQQLLAWRFSSTAEADSDGPVDRQACVVAALLLDVLSGDQLRGCAWAELDFTSLYDELSRQPTSAMVWRHLLALAVTKIPADRPEYRIVASALAAVEQS
jgi:hypothetical protein